MITISDREFLLSGTDTVKLSFDYDIEVPASAIDVEQGLFIDAFRIAIHKAIIEEYRRIESMGLPRK